MEYKWKQNTAAFLSSQAISLFGSSLVQYAIMWYITLHTKSGLMTTLAIICGFLPTLFLSPFAGVWADRYNRKTLIVLADGGIALATLILALFWLGGINDIWMLLLVMVVRALGGAIQQPCVNAMLPDIVPMENLTRINGINGSLNSLITLVSPMISGALMGFAPMHFIFFIDVFTAAAAIVVMLFAFRIPERPAKPAPEKGVYFQEMRQGFRYILKTPYLRNLFGFCIIFWLMIGPVGFLTPLQVARSFSDDVWRLTVVEVAFSVGMLLGGIAISAWGGFKNRIYTTAMAGIIMSLGTLVLGINIPFWLYIAIMAGIGIGMPLFNTPAIVLLQERVDQDYLGRVFSIMNMLSSSIMPLGLLVFGPLADIFAIEYLLILTGIVMIVLSVALLLNKPLLSIGKPLAKQENC